MRALVYHGPGQKAWEEVPDPEITDEGDVIVRVDATTICGTDLHILGGDVPEVHPGRIRGHEAAGTVVEIGDSVRRLCLGDFEQAYDTFGDAASNGALKVVLTREEEDDEDEEEEAGE